MTWWRTAASIATLLGFCISPAEAQTPIRSTTVTPAYDWSGLYIGVAMGGTWSSQDVRTTCTICGQAPGAGRLTDSSVQTSIHGGFNWTVAPSWLAGVEADFTWAGLDGSASDQNRFVDGTVIATGEISWNREVNWIASVRGRLGFAIAPTTLLYVTGGAAWQSVKYTGLDQFFSLCPNCNSASFSQTQMGWVAGAGMEWAFADSWIFRAEYLHFDFGGAEQLTRNNAVFPNTTVTFYWRDTSIDVGRIGVSYKF